MVGVDEVGRGCWAGPLLVVAAHLVGELPEGLTDSKLMTGLRRESIFELLTSNFDFGEGWVSVAEIDQNGLANGLRIGVTRALKALKVAADEQIIMDGKVNYIDPEFKNAECLVDADLYVPIVSAASVYAKVRRDRFMRKLAKTHPNYGFENHVGYGTKAHQLALQKFGVLDGIHRVSYKPVGALL